MLDLAMRVIHLSLDGLATRQRLIAENLANVDTPGYLAARVSFEDNLRIAIADGEAPETAEILTGRSLEATKLNGNNVNPDDETLSLIETGLRYQLAVESMNTKFRILRTSMRRDT